MVGYGNVERSDSRKFVRHHEAIDFSMKVEKEEDPKAIVSFWLEVEFAINIVRYVFMSDCLISDVDLENLFTI